MQRLLPAPRGGATDVDLDEAYAWPEQRCLRVNFVSTLDGAASLDGRTSGLATPADKAVFSHLRATCDVIVVGAGTASAEHYRPARVPVAVVSSRLSPSPEERLFTPGVGTAPPLVLTCAAAPDDRRAALSRCADVVDCGDEAVDLDLAVAELERRGMRRLLCEGGPRLFADLLAAELVDELCLTITPLLTAGTAQRITDGVELKPPVTARLLSALEEDGTLLLRYSAR
ncbi:MAG TPA: dihydrofolate reductase family protein [Acidimicrobiales bacterium]|nr:dihydrofolate reductase family protein [Acidimicrobiales bacterium]